ncbi:UNVERIFIED_ORG: hypothetical protein [Escherichia phage CMSTMSU]
MNARIVESTDKVFIGGDESYKSLCRTCYMDYMRNKMVDSFMKRVLNDVLSGFKKRLVLFLVQ